MPPPTEQPAQQSGSAAITVLLVDDDDLVLELMRRTLQRRIRTVLVAAGPVRARSLLADHPHPIDILVTDVAMPVTSGAELAAIARHHHPRIEVLFISGFPDAAAEGRVPPNALVLAKPFTPHQLCETVLAMVRDRSDGC